MGIQDRHQYYVKDVGIQSDGFARYQQMIGNQSDVDSTQHISYIVYTAFNKVYINQQKVLLLRESLCVCV